MIRRATQAVMEVPASPPGIAKLAADLDAVVNGLDEGLRNLLASIPEVTVRTVTRVTAVPTITELDADGQAPITFWLPRLLLLLLVQGVSPTR